MFSPKLIVFVAFLAVAATYPAIDIIPRPINAISATFVNKPLVIPLPHLIGPFTNLFSSSTNVGPKIDSDDDKFRIIVNVKDYKKDDLKVKVNNGFIFVQGSQETKQDDHDLFTSNFFHTYSLPVKASASDVTATLTSDGFLVVDAPLNVNGEKTNESVDRVVPIIESGEPLKKKNKADKVDKVDQPVLTVTPVDIDESPKVTTVVPSTSAEFDDDRKEPITSSDREEITVKDNAISNDELNEITTVNEAKP
ncbi:unnamed protein product [Euphydryas editha]|uniref:SHSP domain-containing protein n=1 Tax=Euphydryas editha TaxID=104508 RepID=A0AAU9UC89_EUPED|nr:unnamed protein product [Euphydryas editha]